MIRWAVSGRALIAWGCVAQMILYPHVVQPLCQMRLSQCLQHTISLLRRVCPRVYVYRLHSDLASPVEYFYHFVVDPTKLLSFLLGLVLPPKLPDG